MSPEAPGEERPYRLEGARLVPVGGKTAAYIAYQMQTLHGLTYALVSQEGNNTQRSCTVCHSAMRDRDLSQTPTPLGAGGDAVQPVLQ